MNINAISFSKANNTLNKASNKKMSFKGQSDTFEKAITVKGDKTTAKIYTKNLDYKTYDQIKTICSHPVFQDIPIRIMPDVHPSKNTVVGFSAPMSEVGVIPGIIGSDIGCGMLCVKFDTQGQDIDFEKLDEVIRTYTSCNRTKTPASFKKIPTDLKKDLNKVCKDLKYTNDAFQIGRLGTVGQGNHFIEINQDDKGNNYLVVHSGSRSLGKQIAQKHDFIARQQNHYFVKGLSYLTGDEAREYMQDMRIAQKYAATNRSIIADEILYRMGWKKLSSFESVHNYIDDKGIIRKGAISAEKGEQMIIPLNMRDGVILATGKGNPDWNCTAPHGAGRKIARGETRSRLSYEEFEESMKGIYTTSVSPDTLDEAPAAYKDAGEIIENISDTADIQAIMKPIYNFKDA